MYIYKKAYKYNITNKKQQLLINFYVEKCVHSKVNYI